jgi:hypothetical protein
MPRGGFRCDLCHLLFKSKNGWKYHTENNVCLTRRCPGCHEVFKMKSSMDKHMREGCSVLRNNESGGADATRNPSNEMILVPEDPQLAPTDNRLDIGPAPQHVVVAGRKMYTCPNCGKAFTASGLRYHRNRKVCLSRPEEEKKKKRKRVVKLDDQQKLQFKIARVEMKCPKCRMEFKSMNGLRGHILRGNCTTRSNARRSTASFLARSRPVSELMPDSNPLVLNVSAFIPFSFLSTFSYSSFLILILFSFYLLCFLSA